MRKKNLKNPLDGPLYGAILYSMNTTQALPAIGDTLTLSGTAYLVIAREAVTPEAFPLIADAEPDLVGYVMLRRPRGRKERIAKVYTGSRIATI